MITIPESVAFADALSELRAGYPSAVYSEKVCDQMLELSAKHKVSSPIAQAYYAALLGIKAKHVWNPYQKLNYVNEFEKEMTEAVERAPRNLEVRYLRYGIEVNVPAMVGLKKHLAEDLKIIYDLFIASTITSPERSFYQGVFDFMKSQKAYSDSQFNAMQAKLNQIK
jgi:hypothetical protein